MCQAPAGQEGGPLFVGLLSKSAKAALEDYKKKEASAIGSLDALAKENSTLARSQLAAVGFVRKGRGGRTSSPW